MTQGIASTVKELLVPPPPPPPSTFPDADAPVNETANATAQEPSTAAFVLGVALLVAMIGLVAAIFAMVVMEIEGEDRYEP